MKKQKGSILVFALIVLSFILLATFSLSSIALIERRSADISVNSSTAFQQADKGMEEFLQQIYKDLDQNDTLSDLGKALSKMYDGGGSAYDCTEPGNDAPVRMGSQDTQFIITPYRDQGNTITEQVNSKDKETGGWDKVVPITSCATKLADVVRFRSTGNHNNAARAVFLRLRDSLTRGLVAHWAFEDRAQNATLAVNGGDNAYNSFIVGDSSKNNYTLTLCDVYDDNNNPADIEIENDNPLQSNLHIVSFGNCESSNVSGSYMSPYKHELSCGNSDSDYNKKCSDTGAWREGIVQESVGAGGSVGVADATSSEALYFDGSDYITALVDNNDCYGSTPDCDVTVNYVNDSDAKRLDLTEGIAISAWVKMNGTSGKNVIVSKWFNSKGYQLSVDADNSKVCFELNGIKLCRLYDSGDINGGDWAHIVVTWRNKESGDMNIYVNGNMLSGGSSSLVNSISVPSNVPLSIGAQLDDSNSVVAGSFFTGGIDDVRIWNRALTECEISRLCRDAFDQNDKPSGAPDCALVPTGC